jgi:hypothetical protein
MDLHSEIRRRLEQDPALLSEIEQQVPQDRANPEERPSDREPYEAETTAEPQDLGRYRVESGRICIEKISREGGVLTIPLCNFTAKVEEELVLDSGADTTRLFIVRAGFSICGNDLDH